METLWTSVRYERSLIRNESAVKLREPALTVGNWDILDEDALREFKPLENYNQFTVLLSLPVKLSQLIALIDLPAYQRHRFSVIPRITSQKTNRSCHKP